MEVPETPEAQEPIVLLLNNHIKHNMVKIYSTPSCAYCKTLKDYLTKNNIEFANIDVSKDEKELDKMIKDSGQMGVPVVDIDGEIITGFDKQKIDALLKIGT